MELMSIGYFSMLKLCWHEEIKLVKTCQVTYNIHLEGFILG